MNFNEWLELKEAGMTFDRQQQGFSLGDWKKDQQQLGGNTRQSNRFMNRDDRVAYGRGIEKKVYQSLQKCGLKLQPASREQDMYDKIDGWWQEGNQKHPIQIKYRDTGDDILFEVLKDYERNIPGRDMIGKATHYAVLSKDGQTIRVVLVSDAKEIINGMIQQAEHMGFNERGDFSMRVPGGRAMLRLRPDPRSGQKKMMAYIPVSALNPVQQCSANVEFDN